MSDEQQAPPPAPASKFALTGLSDLAHPVEPVEPTSRAEGVRHINYRTLLATGRAVKRKKIYLFVTSAGDNPQIHRLTCTSKTEAQRLGASIMTDLRKARSNDEYNRILIAILADIHRMWPHEPRLEHVHSCGNERCDVGPDGVHPCGFDWREHQLILDCACGPELDQTDAAGEYHFVVHKDMKGKVKVYV